MNKQLCIIIGTQDQQRPNKATMAEQLQQYAQEQHFEATLLFCEDEKSLLNAVESCQKDYHGVIIDTGNIIIDQPALAKKVSAHPAPFVEVILHHQHPQEKHDADRFSNASLASTTMQNVSGACIGVIGGFGVNGYGLAIKALNDVI